MAAIPDWQEPARKITAQRASPVETVILPLDGSGTAKSALPVARQLARLYQATLRILYVGGELRGPRETLEQLGIARDQMRGVVLDHLTVEPVQGILESLSRCVAPLLVMSTHTGNHAADSLLGSVAEALLNEQLDRVVLVSPERGAGEWEIRQVLLAHDGRPSTEVATSDAADIAHRAGAGVLAMHVASRTASDHLEPGSIPAPRYVDQPQHEWPAWANEFLDRMMALGAPPANVRFKLMVTGGQPGSEIADFAREDRSDLVVAAWHGGWGDESSAVLKVVVRRAGCPVLLVYAPEHQS